MKIALCLHGYFAGAGGTPAAEVAFNYLDRKVMYNNNVDVFIHSWDLENQNKVTNLYKPTACQFEEQHLFEEEMKHFDEEWFNEEFSRRSTMYHNNTIFRGLSFLYSRMRALEIKREYETQNNFEYDCVVLSRFDVSTRGKEHPQTYYVTNMNFNKALDMQYLYSAYWKQMNHGYADHWFYSNSETMDQVGNLYNKVKEYYQKDSAYIKAVTEGWPESNKEDEFSNECMKGDSTEEVQRSAFPKWGCIDNHKLYKWYFMDTGLHASSRYVDITQDTPTPRIYNHA